MTEQRERIADAAIAWARAVQRLEDARRHLNMTPTPTREQRDRKTSARTALLNAQKALLQACGKVGE